MPWNAPQRSSAPLETALQAVGPAGAEMSLIDVVLLACDVTEDETEVNDVVDALIQRGAARVLPAAEDEMLTRVEEESPVLAA